MRNYAMRIRKINGRGMGIEGPGDLQEAGDSQVLLLALKELVGRLSGAGVGAPASASGPVERWEDEGYLYLEAGLPGTLELDIDVTIQAGRAFIRMVR
jgi:HSP20 family molecular chaperone IbpA